MCNDAHGVRTRLWYFARSAVIDTRITPSSPSTCRMFDDCGCPSRLMVLITARRLLRGTRAARSDPTHLRDADAQRHRVLLREAGDVTTYPGTVGRVLREVAVMLI